MKHTEEYLTLDGVRKQTIKDFSLKLDSSSNSTNVNLNNLTYLEMKDLGFNLVGKQEPEFAIPLWITPHFKSYIAFDGKVKVIEKCPLILRYNHVVGMDYLIRPCDYDKFKWAYEFEKERRTTIVYESVNKIRNAILNSLARKRLETEHFNAYDSYTYLSTIGDSYSGYSHINIANLRRAEALELGFKAIDDNLFLIPNWINLYGEKIMFYGYVPPHSKNEFYLSQKPNKRLLEAQLNLEPIDGFSPYVVEFK